MAFVFFFASTGVIFIDECLVLYLSTKFSRTSVYLLALFAVKYLKIVLSSFGFNAQQHLISLRSQLSKAQHPTPPHVCCKTLGLCLSKAFLVFALIFENLLERVCDRFSSFVFERKHPTIF